MTPYYERAGITIYHGDCRDILPCVQADTLLGDPPYGVNESYLSYDDTPERLVALIATAWPLMKRFKRVALTVGTKNLHRWPDPLWTLAWFTPAGVGCGPWGFCCWQPILVYGPDPYLELGKGSQPDAVIRTEAAPKFLHPCEKPVALWRWVLSRVSAPTDVIVDPFMGAGTTLEVAKLLGQRAIGIEIEERYCEIAAERLAQDAFQFEIAQ